MDNNTADSCVLSDSEMREIHYALHKKVYVLSKLLHAAVKEWATHVDKDIKSATVKGNVMKENLHIVLSPENSPSWFTIKD